jgi:hypothetical protein
MTRRRVNERIPKAQWAPGPWHDEPDHLDWTDERTGLPCCINRQMIHGQLNGYAGVPTTHPFFGWNWDDHIEYKQGDLYGKDADDIGLLNSFAFGHRLKHGTIWLGALMKAHGGINWSGELPWGDVGRWWWFGFDCGHAGDVQPGLDAIMHGVMPPEHMRERALLFHDWKYRTIAYVKAECASLAFQLRELETRTLVNSGTFVISKGGDSA